MMKVNKTSKEIPFFFPLITFNSLFSEFFGDYLCGLVGEVLP